jgi:polygalacturonase
MPELNFLYPLDLPFARCSPFNCRAKLVVLFNCSHVLLDSEIHLRNSPLWTLQIGLSHDVTVRNSFISADIRAPNNDGIDVVSSFNILIENCSISTGDDNIDLSTHIADRPTYNVTVRGCRLSSSSCSLNTGMFALADIFDVFFYNNSISQSNRGIGIMPRIGAGRIFRYRISEIDISTKQYSTAWWGSGEPVYISSLDFGQGFSGSVSEIDLRNIRISAAANSVFVFSSNSSKIFNVSFSEIDLQLSTAGGNVTRPCHDFRPNNFGNSEQIVPALVDGFYLGGNCGNIYLNDVGVAIDKSGPPNYFGECFNFTSVAVEESGRIECN